MENDENLQQNVAQTGIQHDQQLDALMREGGSASAELGVKEISLSVNGDRVPTPAAHTSPSESIVTGKAISVFAMENPFGGAAKNEALQSTIPTKAIASSLPPASSDSRAGGEPTASIHYEDVPFSKLSATALAKSIGDKISTFKSDVWISEDINGAAFLEVVTLSSFSNFLASIMPLESYFVKLRVEKHVKSLILADKTLSADIQAAWTEMEAKPAIVLHNPSQNIHVAAPTNLFRTPETHKENARPAAQFLSEIKSRVGFSMDDSSLFDSPGQSTIQPSSDRRHSTSYSLPGDANQHSATPYQIIVNPVNNIQAIAPPNYQILEHCDNEEAFYNWLYKNRKETLLAPAHNRRALTELMSKECKEEISSVIVKAQRGRVQDLDLFTTGAPYPARGWCDVTEKLALRVLFKVNGPKSATDAKARLKKRKFYFNDHTTEQKYFTQKLKNHIRQFSQQLEDFGHSFRIWPEHDKNLSHTMIVDAFSDNFSSTETIVGPDKVTHVPRCANNQILRDKIRDHKGLPLEEIQVMLVEHFERIDDDIKAHAGEGCAYKVVPWNKNDKKQNKRNFNQHEARNGGAVAGGGGGNGGPTAKKIRPPPKFDRCNNCGSKGHPCGERTCYMWGHPKAKGKDGTWNVGEASLRLEQDEWDAWKKIRHATFYSYPENQNKGRDK